jgi:hypothetical protein
MMGPDLRETPAWQDGALLSPAARLDCIETISLFCVAIDNRNWFLLMNQLVREPIFINESVVFSGCREVMEFLQQRPSSRISRHHCCNTILTYTGSGTISAETEVTVYRCNGCAHHATGPHLLVAPYLVGTYTDILAFEDGRWRIATRRFRATFMAEENKTSQARA